MRTFLYIILWCAIMNTGSILASEIVWQGDTAAFITDNNHIYSQFNPDNSYAEISISQPISEDCSWKFSIQMDFNPSSNNNTIIHLNSNPSVTNHNNGYYLTVGKDNDALQFFIRNDGKDSLLISGIEKQFNLTPVLVDIEITRSNNSLWHLYSKLPNIKEYTLVGSANNASFSQFYSFAIGCHYTKTRVGKFQFHSFHFAGTTFSDTIPPKLLNLVVVDAHTLQLAFDEEISANKDDFSINDDSIKISEIEISHASVFINTKNTFQQNKLYTIDIKNVTDKSDNVLKPTSHTFTFTPFQLNSVFMVDSITMYTKFSKPPSLENILQHISFNNAKPTLFHADENEENAYLFIWEKSFKTDVFLPFSVDTLLNQNKTERLDTTIELAFHALNRGDLVLSELMSDPSPQVQLSEAEYIELFNTSDYNISYSQIRIYIAEKEFDLSEYNIVPPQSYLLITNEKDREKYNSTYKTASTNSSFTLTNGGFEIALTTGSEKVIDYFKYEPEVILPEFKSNGGWSVERMDNETLSSQNNWGASSDNSGGTPGYENSIASVVMDQKQPTIDYILVHNDTTIVLVFSEEMDIIHLENRNDYSITDALIESGNALLPSQKEVALSVTNPLEPFKNYTLSIQPIPDLEGNYSAEQTYRFRLPEHPTANDVVFNEIMFDPASGCPEYIELFNRSAKFVDLSQIILTETEEDGTLKEGALLMDRPLLFAPASYIILTKSNHSSESCILSMDSSQVITPSNFPTLNNDAQNITLVTLSGQVIDQLTYTANWHTSLLSDGNGLALEKIHPDYPSNESNSWTSAASLSGYATPGYKNSQYIASTSINSHLKLAYENISPNNDGYQDALLINIPQQFAEYSASIQIFDANGRLICEVCNNYFLGTQSTFYWNKFSSHQFSTGIYAVRIRAVHPDGNTLEEMLPFVVSFK